MRITAFKDLILDFNVSHKIHNIPYEFVFRNRDSYSAYFILAIVEMIKFAVKEDYESSRTDNQFIKINVEQKQMFGKSNRCKANKARHLTDFKYQDSQSSE